MPPPLLQVEDLTVTIAHEAGVAKLIDGISLTIDRGEIVSVIGESGSGKTTLVRALLGILPGNAAIGGGRIVLDGEDLSRISERRVAREVRGRKISYIPQDPAVALDPLFTIGRQVKDVLAGKLPPGVPLLDRAIEYLEAVHLAAPHQILRRRTAQVSGGQRQRIMIALALAVGPKMVVADEPTTALDVTIQAQILKLLRQQVDQRGVAMLMTTHDLAVAREVSDCIAVMYAGRILETAPIEPLLRTPRHPYTRSLLDARLAPGRKPVPIAGESISPLTPMLGCRFAPRCARRIARCEAEEPPLSPVTPTQSVRCWSPVP